MYLKIKIDKKNILRSYKIIFYKNYIGSIYEISKLASYTGTGDLIYEISKDYNCSNFLRV